MKKKRKKLGRKLLSWLLTLAMIVGLMPGMGVTAYAAPPSSDTGGIVAGGVDIGVTEGYASIKNTTTAVTFGNKEWYLIDYDSSTVTLLSKECVGASAFDSNGSSNTYNGSTVETYVNNWYTDDNNISADAKTAVSGSGAFLLTTDQANAITNTDVRKCSQATGVSYNCWWLSSRDSATYATCVDGDSGDVYINGGPVGEEFGVRPALKLDLSKVTFDSTSKTFTVVSASAPDTYYSSYVPTGDEDAEGLAAKQVTFNGIQWYIIQDNSTAVDAGTVTLLAKNPIGTSEFDDSSNAYATSDVRDYLVALTVDGGQFANAADAIVGTNLDDVNVTGEKLYLLSIDEAEALSENVRKCDPVEGENIVPVWLLRSTDKNPDSEDGVGCVLCDEGEVMYYKPSEDTGSSVSGQISIGTVYVTCNITSVCSVRPALQLDLSKVVFNSGTNTFSLPVPDPVASVTTYNGTTTEYTDFAEAVNAWNTASNTLISNTYKAGATLKLLADVETSTSVKPTVSCSSDYPMILDLNGYGIRYTGDEKASVIYVEDRSGLNLKMKDSNPNRVHYITLDSNGRGIAVSDTTSEGAIEVTGGYITGGNGGSSYGGGVHDMYSFVLEGGTIVGNTSNYGAGVRISQSGATFTMTGGTITGNKASDVGGGVYFGSTCVFNLSGGTITGNSAGTNGGGVYVLARGTFNLSGGAITGNKASTDGGGVFVTGSATFNLSGDASITGNQKGTEKNNVYLNNRMITVNGALDGADIGVTMATPGVFTSSTDPIKASDYKDQFSSDDSTYSVMIQENELKLGTHEHSFTYSADGATITATCSNEGCDLTDKKVTLTIVKPVLETYGGTGETAATLDGLDAFNTATGQAIAATQIKYVGRDGTTYAESATAPLAAGKYTASITLTGVKTDEGEDKSVIASVDYEIAKADQTVNAPAAYQNLVYDGKSQQLLESSVTVSVGNRDAVVQYKTGEDGDWGSGTPYATDAGQYTLYYKVPGNENYNDFTGSVTATIAKADQEVEAPVGREDLVYTGYLQQLIDNLPHVVKGNMTSTPEYKVDDDDWSMSHPSAVSVGSHTVYYRIPESDNYNAYEGSIQVAIAKADPAAPTGLTATYGQTLADVNLPAGWTWVNSTVSVGNAGTHSFQANCNPTDTGNYNTLSNVDLSVTVSAAEPTANAPTGLTATYGQTLADITLTNPGGNTPGTWEFVDAGTTSVGNAGEHTFQVKFTPTDAVNYNTLSNVDVTVTVSKADQTAPAAPTKAGATTNSITLTAVDGCEYRMGTDGTWQETPTFTGLTINTEYTFYQRLKEDANHNASPVSQSATISTNNHVHEWSYAAGTGENADTITATCANTDGGHDGELTARITVVKPEKTTYGDSGSANATIEGSIVGVTNPVIVYKKGTEELTSAPTEAGTYTASITLGGATATVEYIIARKQVTVSGITADDKTYDGNTVATLVTTAAIFEGKLSGDALTVSAVGAFENANAGENKAVTISGLTLGGNDKDNYVLAAEGQQTGTTATITAKEVGLEWSNTELTYNGLTQAPTATATGLVSGDTCIVTVSGEQTNVGNNYTATASSLSNSNYKLPENKTTTFKISRANAIAATVTANNRTYDGTEKTLVTVTGETTGGTLKFAVTTENQEPNSEAYTFDTTSIPTKTNAGTYYVWYKVVGDTNHDGIAAASIKVTIAPKALSNEMLALTPDSFVQDTTVKAPTITVTDTAKSPNALEEGTDYTLAADAQTSGTDYGTYTVTVNGKGNYTSSATKTWKIEDKTAPTATITVDTHSFNQFLHTITFGIFFKKTQAVTITAEDNAGGSGIKEVYYYVSNTALTEDAVKALADGSWKEITNGKSFNIDPTRKYVVYVKAVDSSGNKGYVSSDGMVIDAAVPVITGVVAGAEYHSAVNWKAADDYLDKVEITFIAAGKTAGESVTDTKTADGTQLEDTVSALGSYTVKAKDKSGNETTVAFSITRRNASITGNTDSITYEAGKTYDLSQLFTVENGVTVDTYEIVANADTNAATGAGTITGSTLTVTKAGLITIRATVAEGQTSAATPEYINKTTAEGTLTVSRADGTASITINDVVYGNQFTVLLSSTNVGVTSETKYTMTADAAGNEIPAASRTESTEKPVNAGTYKAVVSYPATGLYNAVSAETTFQITPATLTVTAEAKEKTYGGEDPELTYTVSGLKYEDTKETVLTGALTRAAGEDVGTYAIGQGTLAANGNYTISYTGANLTIGKKTLTVTAEAKSKTYGAEDPALTYSVSGLENGDTKETVLTGALTRAAGEDVGTYAIGQGTLTANGNYTVNYIGADLTIGKKTLTVTAEAKSKTYGGADPTLTYTVSGLENGDTKETVLTGALTRAAGEDVGTYAIVQGTLAANGNYTINYNGADLTIGKKTLTVTAEAKSKKYGEDDPALTYTATGFESGDTKDTVLTGALTRKSGEAVGTYAIQQGTLAANDNYTISYTGADLTIIKTDSKVPAPIANTLTYTGKAQALITAGSTTDGTIVYSLDGKTYAETIPTGANAGEYTVYYKVMGDGNHKDSEAVTVSVTIAKAEMADKTVADVIEVISAGVKDETMDLTEYLKDGAKLEKAETAGELAEYITPGALTGGIFTYSVAENDGGIAGSIVLTVSSTNYKDYNITINLVSAKKITEVVVESEDVKETAVEAVEVPALEDFTEAQPEATVEVKMEVKLESEETVEKALGTAVLEDIKETVAKAFDGVASTELSQEYLDITVTKSVNGGTAEEIADVNRVLEIAVGYDLTGKFNPVVIREHGGAVSQFTKLSSRPAAGNYKDGTFYVEGSGTSSKIYIYARYFSTYTVAYTTAASYQVTFDDATGDAKHDSNVTQVVVATGTKVAKPADPKRDGYDFEGWYISGTNTKWNFDTAVTGDITLVAHWDEEDDDDDEVVATPAPVVTTAPRSPKTSDAAPGYAFWLMLAAAGICGVVSTRARRKEQD